MDQLRLNIGCGTYYRKEPGWIYCDLFPSKNCDVIFDATKAWPFPDNSVTQIKCNHVLEHLGDYETFFKEAHRVLIPNGYFAVTVPYGLSSAGMADVAHIKYWLPGSFAFLQPGYGESVHNPQHIEEYPFCVEICLVRIAPQMRWLVNGFWRRWGLKLLPHLLDSYNEISVMLRALKTEDDIAHFKRHRDANGIPGHRVMHKYEYEGKTYAGGPVELVFLDNFQVGYITTSDVYDQLQKQK